MRKECSRENIPELSMQRGNQSCREERGEKMLAIEREGKASFHPYCYHSACCSAVIWWRIGRGDWEHCSAPICVVFVHVCVCLWPCSSSTQRRPRPRTGEVRLRGRCRRRGRCCSCRSPACLRTKFLHPMRRSFLRRGNEGMERPKDLISSTPP